MEAADEKTITTIEGNSCGGVRRDEHRADKDVIAGCGLFNAAYKSYPAAQPSITPRRTRRRAPPMPRNTTRR